MTKKSCEWAQPQVRRMVEAIRHESAYETGVLGDEPQGVYVGWGARKRSFSKGMPVRSERNDVVLVFSGEEFPMPGTTARLKQKGHVFDKDGPSYLVHLYEDDPSFPSSLNGRFHGFLIDRVRGTSTLFNDRYGMHRIYYHESKEAFYFSTEAKAILSILPKLRTVNLRSLGEFISCGCVLEDRTLFDSIHVLPAAAAWVFRQGSIEKNSYFQPQEWENQDPLDPEAYYLQVRETFSRNLPRYFEGSERIGMSLTGGLDTRMIMAWQKSAPGALPCYSFGGMFRDSQDVVLARQVARTCEQPYQVIPLAKEFLWSFANYAERTIYLTDGCAAVTRSSDLYANEIAAQIAPIRMTGNYGSEILRRIVAFKPSQPAPGMFHPELLAHVDAATQTYSKLRRGHALSFIAFRQTPWHHHGLRALEETQLSLRSPFLDNDLVQLAFRAPGASTAKSDIFAREDKWVQLIGEGNPALRRLRTDRGLAGDSGPLISLISRHLLEFTFKAEYAYDYGMPQSVARVDHFFSWLHLERLFLGRHKFNHFRFWYREALSQYVREILLDQRTLSRPYLNRNTVEIMVHGHLKGNRNYTSEIHTLLTLELIHRLFIDAQKAPTLSVRETATVQA